MGSVVGAESHRFQQALLNTTSSIRPDALAVAKANHLHNGRVANYGTFVAPDREKESSGHSLLDSNSLDLSVRTDGESPKRGYNHDENDDGDGAKPSKILKIASATDGDNVIDDSVEDIPDMDPSDSIEGEPYPSVGGHASSSMAAVDLTIAAVAGVLCAVSVWKASSSVRKRRCQDVPSIDAQVPPKRQPSSSVPSTQEATSVVGHSSVAARVTETVPSVPVTKVLGSQRECSLCHVTKSKAKFSKNQWKKNPGTHIKCADCVSDGSLKAKQNSKKNAKTAPEYGHAIYDAKQPPPSGWRQPLYPMNGQRYDNIRPLLTEASGERFGTMSSGPFAQPAPKARPPGGIPHTFGRYGWPNGR